METPLITSLLLLGCMGLVAANSFSMPTPWTYTCDKNSTHSRCIKEEYMGLSSSEPMSLEACKLICDEFGTLWPKPVSVVTGDKLVYFTPLTVSKTYVASPEDTVLLDQAFALFLGSLNKYNPDYNGDDTIWSMACGPTNDVAVTIELIGSKPRLGLDTTDEEYSLTISTAGLKTTAKIIANTFFGARHALESLSQLVEYEDEKNSLMMVESAAITDKPAFPYRGLLLDTARNFFPIESLQRIIDAMSYNKLNTFHWHITESNSFPYVMRSLPKMALYGAHTTRQLYYPQDIKDLVEYGRVRGVRVLPELDAPAHVGNGWQWGPQEGLGDLAVCVNREPWQEYCVQPPCGQLNIANDNIYPVLEKMYQQMVEDFGPLDLFHYGGDEVNVNCWNTTKDIVDWMKIKRQDLTADNYYREWSAFQDKAYNAFTRANADQQIPGIIWTSHLTEKGRTDQYLDRNKYIIQIWSTGEDPLIAELLQKNYRVIFSNYDHWYLDCGFGAWVGDGNNWCSPYKGWQKVYDNDINKIAQNLTDNTANLDLVLGGEACLWSEQVDSMNVEPKLWPRGAALAERLWSNPSHGWAPAEYRMVNHRQRLVKRGIMAERLQPQWCHQNEHLCYINKA